MLTCIAVDDEPLALEILKKYIAKIYFLELKGTFTDPFEAKKMAEENPVDAIDYLLKPIEYDRFLKAVYKAKEYTDYLSNQEMQDGYIFVKSDYQMVKINLKDILYIEGLDDYIKIYLPQKSILTLMTLKTIALKLPSKEFLRVHRSYIVPVPRIENISKSKIRIADKEIPIGVSYSDSFFAAMDKKIN